MFINQPLIAIYIRHNPNANKLTIKVDINDAKKYDIAKVFLSVGVIIKSLIFPFSGFPKAPPNPYLKAVWY